MGISVVAEGIETVEEFRLCRDVGADYAQGFLIDRPREDGSVFPDVFESVTRIGDADRRNRAQSQDIILRKMEVVEPIVTSDPIAAK